MTPTVGRIVHYYNLGDAQGRFPSEAQAAIVTNVHVNGAVSLCVFYGNDRGGGQFFMPRVEFSAEPEPGRWTWPPRVP